MTCLLQDLRFALRMLWKNVGFSITAVMTLALGIGASTAIFSVIKGALLHPWPYHGYDRIVTVRGNYPKIGRQELPTFSVPEIDDLTQQTQVFENVLAGVARNVNVTNGTEPERVRGAAMTANSFAMLGVEPLMGRVFRPSDSQPGAAPVVVLSYRFWKNRQGFDPTIIGKTLKIEGTPYMVIGVMPEEFVWWDRELWTPLQMDPAASRTRREFYVQGTLRPGISIAQAEAALQVFARKIQADHGDVPEYQGWSITLHSLVLDVLRDLRPALYILFGAVLLLMTIGCANVANMMLVQATTRETEIAIRTALGARAKRITRQLLTESIVISGVGGALGFALSVWGVRAIQSLVPFGYIPAEADVRTDLPVALFCVSISVGLGFVVGSVPALQVFRTDVFRPLREGKTSASSVKNRRLRSGFLVAQIALAVVVLSGASLMLRSFRNTISTSRGFDSKNVLVLGLPLSADKYREPGQALNLYQEMLRRISALPGAKNASMATSVPVGVGRSFVFKTADSSAGDAVQGLDANFDSVSPQYFPVLEIPVVQGRLFTGQDREGTAPVAIVNQTMAGRMWPNGNAIGKPLRLALAGPESPGMVVVGIVGDVKSDSLISAPRPAVYIPWTQSQSLSRSLVLAVKTAGSPLELLPVIRREIAALDPDLPIALPETLEAEVANLNGPQRLATTLLAAFGTIALLLSVVGIYATVSHSVVQRKHEFGIRMALGAAGAHVLGLVMSEAIKLVACGLALGIGISLAAARVLSGFLYGVSPTDPITLALMAAVLMSAALLASYGPARRAIKIDPMLALR